MVERRRHSGAFKAKVVVEALKGEKRINQIASRHGVHLIQITQWKKRAPDGLPGMFGDRGV